MLRIHLTLSLLLLGVTALSAAEPVSNSRYQNQIPQRTASQLKPMTLYDVYIAEPVPDLMYRLEYRYLETRTQEGSDWKTYSTSEYYDVIEDGIFWIALHLVAEWRVTEFVPRPTWEKEGTYQSRDAAEAAMEMWEDLGFLTRLEIRYSGPRIDTSQLELVIQPGF